MTSVSDKPLTTYTKIKEKFSRLMEQDAQLSQRDRAAGYISFGQK